MKFLLAFVLVVVCGATFAQYGKPVSPAEEKKNFAVLLNKLDKAKAGFVKRPKDVQAKHAYVESNVALGLQYTYANTVDRKVKYKKALVYLREALKYEPQHKVARQMHDQIVSIYKSMGRSVPGG